MPTSAYHLNWKALSSEAPGSKKRKLVIVIATTAATVASSTKSYHASSNDAGLIAGSRPAHSTAYSIILAIEIWAVALHYVTLVATVSCFVKLMHRFIGKAQQEANFTATGSWSCTFRAGSTPLTWLPQVSWFVAAGGPVAMTDPSAVAILPDHSPQRALLFHLGRCHRVPDGRIRWPARESPMMSWS